MKKLKKCAICGVTEEEKIIANVHGTLMCSKHKAQYYRHGKITDKTSRTTQDKNKIIKHETFAEIFITNNKNTKQYKAIIDLEDVPRIEKYKWRYETGNFKGKGYAVTGGPSKKRMSLHRFILNYNGPLQVDHINRNTLDNRKENLRIVPQVINAQNLTMKNNCIEKTSNNKYRVKIIRFKRIFMFGLFDTKEEANHIIEEFLDFMKANEEIMVKNYYNENHDEYRFTSFKNGNKTFQTKMFKTLEETIKNRPDIQALLKTEQATA